MDLKSLVEAATKAHPAFRFATAVAGIAALVAIFSKFGISPIALVLGTLVSISLMAIFVIFASLSRLPDRELALPGRVILWTSLILMISTLILLYTSAFFGKPLPLRLLISGYVVKADMAKQSPKNIDRVRVALVIGNSSYKDSPLIAPKNDATMIASRLTKAGFRVKLLLDATREEIFKSWSHIDSVATYGGVALLYYSGHGVSVNGIDYIVPVDAYSVSRESLVEKNFVAIPFLAGMRAQSLASGSNGELFLYSAAPGEMAQDASPGSVYSPFALAFASALSQKNVDIYDVFRLASVATKNKTKDSQSPWIAGNFNGTFYPNATEYDSSFGILRLMVFDAARVNPFYR